MLSSAVKIIFILINVLCFPENSVNSQNIPRIACPNLFQYQRLGDSYIGKITVKDLPLATLKVEAEFSQRESILQSFRMSLLQDLQTTQSNIENGHPISYRIDFPNPYILPKLTSIKINEQTVCSDNGLPPPSTNFRIHHIFYPAVTTFNRPLVQQPNYYPPPPKNTYTFSNNVYESNRNIFSTEKSPDVNIYNIPSFVNTVRNPLPQPNFVIDGIPQQNTITSTPILRQPTPIQPKPTPIRPKPTQPQPSQPTLPELTPSVNVRCGQENAGLTPLIVGGAEFERGRFPWLTAVYIRQGADFRFTCGGSLISSRTVITAAHCFLDPQITADRVVVQLGRHNLYSSEKGVLQYDISTLIRHPQFNVSAMADADLALLIINTPVSFTQYIRPICMWPSTNNFNVQALQQGFVAGWGDDNNGNEITPVPKVVEVVIVSENECLHSSGVFSALTSTRTLCAGNRDGTGPCVGDSGGGLMMSSQGSWYLRAVTSLGLTKIVQSKKACNLNEFVVYCDIAKHITWVKSNMLN